MERVEIQGIPIDLLREGEGLPLLAVHGWSADHRYLRADLEESFRRRPGWQRVYFDLPGHGATPAPDWLGTQAQMLAIVRDVADAAFGSRPFAVVGNSYGGYLALGLVRTVPARLLGAALLVPDLPNDRNERDAPAPVTLEEDRSLFTDLVEDEQWIPAALVVHEQRMLDEIRAHDMPGYRVCDRVFLERLNAAYVHTGEAADGGVAFAQPSLVVSGLQDATVGWRAQQLLQPEFPRGTFARLDLAGHHIGRIERPALFTALMVDWLERMERAVPPA